MYKDFQIKLLASLAADTLLAGNDIPGFIIGQGGDFGHFNGKDFEPIDTPNLDKYINKEKESYKKRIPTPPYPWSEYYDDKDFREARAQMLRLDLVNAILEKLRSEKFTETKREVPRVSEGVLKYLKSEGDEKPLEGEWGNGDSQSARLRIEGDRGVFGEGTNGARVYTHLGTYTTIVSLDEKQVEEVVGVLINLLEKFKEPGWTKTKSKN